MKIPIIADKAVLPGVEGYVKDNEGNGIINVKVTLYKSGYQHYVDYTNAQGYYDVHLMDPIMQPIYVTLKYEKSGYLTKIVGTTAKPRQVVRKDVTLYTSSGSRNQSSKRGMGY